ncbi:unnamed protein product, partial [Cuscuta epithymum]
MSASCERVFCFHLAMSGGCVFLIGVIDRVVHYSWLTTQVYFESPITRPPPEPPPYSKKKIALNKISFSVAGQTDDSNNFCPIEFPLLVDGQTNSPVPVAGEAGSYSCNFVFSLWSSKKSSNAVRLDYIIARLA